MNTFEAFILGAMAAWTPGLIIFALLLWQAPLESDGSGLSDHRYRQNAAGYD
jgi:hypothetical protein